jgi:hypothetical protein
MDILINVGVTLSLISRGISDSQTRGQERYVDLAVITKSWFSEASIPRLVKTSISEKVLLDILPDNEESDCFHIYLRNFVDYRDLDHLWCEESDSVISVQRFIDTSYDGIVISDAKGIMLSYLPFTSRIKSSMGYSWL